MYTPPCSVTLDLNAYETSGRSEALWEEALDQARSELLMQHQEDLDLLSDAMAEPHVWDGFCELYAALLKARDKERIFSLASQLKVLIHETLIVYLSDDIEERADRIYRTKAGELV